MLRAAPFLIALFAAAAGPAGAAVKAGATAHAVVSEQTTVRMAWTMAMPSVQGGSSGASFMSATPSMTMGTMMMPPTRVRREDPSGEPVTAPTSFEVVGDPGAAALIVRTAGGPGIRIVPGGAIVDGALLGGAAASIGIGHELAAGGPLVVVVQYN
jgi:hypothetical protein